MGKSIVTVVTPATSRAFVLKSTVKSELGITSNSQDSNIDRWILQASAAVESYCDRRMVAEKVSEQFRLRQHYSSPLRHGAGFGDSSYTAPVSAGRLILARYPVVSIDSVTIDGTALDVSEFEVDPDTGLLQRLRNDHPAQWTGNKVVVVYTGGYTVPPASGATMPADIQGAIIQLARLARSSSRRDPALKSRNVVGVLEEEFWVGSLTDGGPFPENIAATIDVYRDTRI